MMTEAECLKLQMETEKMSEEIFLSGLNYAKENNDNTLMKKMQDGINRCREIMTLLQEKKENQNQRKEVEIMENWKNWIQEHGDSGSSEILKDTDIEVLDDITRDAELLFLTSSGVIIGIDDDNGKVETTLDHGDFLAYSTADTYTTNIEEEYKVVHLMDKGWEEHELDEGKWGKPYLDIYPEKNRPEIYELSQSEVKEIRGYIEKEQHQEKENPLAEVKKEVDKEEQQEQAPRFVVPPDLKKELLESKQQPTGRSHNRDDLTL